MSQTGDAREHRGGARPRERDDGPTGPAGRQGRGADAGGSGALRVAQYAVAAAAAVFIVLALVRSWDEVRAYDWSPRPTWLALSGLAFVAFYVSQAVAWWLVLHAVGVTVPLPWAAATWGQSILARYVPGNVFMFVGRGLASRRRGLPLRIVSAAMVYEQVLGFCAALVTLGLLLPFWDERPASAPLSLLGIPALLVLLHPRAFVPLADRALRALRREPLGVRLGLGRVLALLCYYVAAWFLAGLACWLLAGAVAEVDVGLLPTVTAAYAFAFVVGMVAFVFPGGLGVREAVLGGVLAGSLGAGVALAWAVLLRLWQVVMELAFVGLVTLAGRGSRGGESADGAAGEATREAEGAAVDGMQAEGTKGAGGERDEIA